MQCIPESADLRFHGSIYGIGDSICFINPKTNTPVPGTARAAMTQATIAAHNIMQEILFAEGKISKANVKAYEPKNYPYVIPIGGKFAIAKLGSVIVSGFWGWVLKGLVELNYLFSIMPFRRAIPIWFKGLSIFIKNDRLG
jgi:NADH dehydrogenase